MGEWGYRYGELASGVLTQETFSGLVANIFNDNRAEDEGVNLRPNDFAEIGIDLMIRDFNARTAAGSPARRGEELSVDTIETYHAAAFARFGVSIEAWTPHEALAAQSTQAGREDLWDRLLRDNLLTTGVAYTDILLDAFTPSGSYGRAVTAASIQATFASSGDFGDYSIIRTIGGETSAIVGGGPGNSSITLSNRGDVALGFAGNDTITGGSGDDRICGGQDADVLTGGGGADLIDGGDSSSFFGGANVDIYVDSFDSGANDVLLNIERIVGRGDGSYDITDAFSDLPFLLELRALGTLSEPSAPASARCIRDAPPRRSRTPYATVARRWTLMKTASSSSRASTARRS